MARKARRRGLSLALRAVAALALLVVALPLGLLLPLRWLPPPQTAFMAQARLSALLADASPGIDYRWVPLEKISPQAALAVIASEDQRFFGHWGVDVEAVRKARSESRSGRALRGASTLTQQVAKNLFLWSGRSYLRKGIEAYLAVWIELLWPKQRILEVYLNVAEMGPGVYGVGAAADRCFDTTAAALTEREASVLAAVLPNPRAMRCDRPSAYVLRRAAWIRRQMRQLGGTRFLETSGTPMP